MAARHGTISPTLRAGVPFSGGAEAGGGGAAVVVCTLPCGGGGVAGGSSVRRGCETRWRPLGSWAPSRKNLGFAGGDSASMYRGVGSQVGLGKGIRDRLPLFWGPETHKNMF